MAGCFERDELRPCGATNGTFELIVRKFNTRKIAALIQMPQKDWFMTVDMHTASTFRTTASFFIYSKLPAKAEDSAA